MTHVAGTLSSKMAAYLPNKSLFGAKFSKMEIIEAKRALNTEHTWMGAALNADNGAKRFFGALGVALLYITSGLILAIIDLANLASEKNAIATLKAKRAQTWKKIGLGTLATGTAALAGYGIYSLCIKGAAAAPISPDSSMTDPTPPSSSTVSPIIPDSTTIEVVVKEPVIPSATNEPRLPADFEKFYGHSYYAHNQPATETIPATMVDTTDAPSILKDTDLPPKTILEANRVAEPTVVNTSSAADEPTLPKVSKGTSTPANIEQYYGHTYYNAHHEKAKSNDTMAKFLSGISEVYHFLGKASTTTGHVILNISKTGNKIFRPIKPLTDIFYLATIAGVICSVAHSQKNPDKRIKIDTSAPAPLTTGSKTKPKKESVSLKNRIINFFMSYFQKKTHVPESKEFHIPTPPTEEERQARQNTIDARDAEQICKSVASFNAKFIGGEKRRPRLDASKSRLQRINSLIQRQEQHNFLEESNVSLEDLQRAEAFWTQMVAEPTYGHVVLRLMNECTEDSEKADVRALITDAEEVLSNKFALTPGEIQAALRAKIAALQIEHELVE